MKPVDKGIPVSKLTGVPGWETDDEEDTLCFYASQVPENGVIVEIGAEYGRSASQFLKSSGPSVTVLSMDLFPMTHHAVGDLMDACKSNLQESCGSEIHRWRPYRVDSHDAANVEGVGMVDLLFIDGDHEYAGVWADIKVWTPLVRQGGVVAFHDVADSALPNVHPLHWEVLKAVNELIDSSDDWALERNVDSLRLYRRL